MAERIADFIIIGRHAAANGWRLPEHFTNTWSINRTYAGSPMLRPYGTTPGRSLESSRLLLQFWELGGRKLNWLPQCSKALLGQEVLPADQTFVDFYIRIFISYDIPLLDGSIATPRFTMCEAKWTHAGAAASNML
jgi:hypothetical protein